MTYNNRSHILQDDNELPQVFQRLGSASRPNYNSNYKGRKYDPNYNNNNNNNNRGTGMRIVRSSRFDSGDLYISTTNPGGSKPSLPDYNKISQIDDSAIYYSPSHNSEDSDNYSHSNVSNSPTVQTHPQQAQSNKSNFNFVRTVEAKVISRPIISFVKDQPSFGNAQGDNNNFGYFNDQQQTNMILSPSLSNNNNNHHHHQQQQQQNWNNYTDSDYHRTAVDLDNRAKSIKITASLSSKDSDKNGSDVIDDDINQDFIMITPASRKVTVTTSSSTAAAAAKRDRRKRNESRSRSPSPASKKKHNRRSSIMSRSRSRSRSPSAHRKRRRSASSEGNSRSRAISRRRRSRSSSRSASPSLLPPLRHHSRNSRRSISPRSTRRRYESSEEEGEEDVAPFLKQRDDFYRPDYSQLDGDSVDKKKKKEDINKRSPFSVSTTNKKKAKSYSPPLDSSINTVAKRKATVSTTASTSPSTTKAAATTAGAKKELQSHPPLGTLSNVAADVASFSTTHVTAQTKKKDLRSYPPLEVLDPSAAPRPYNKSNASSPSSPPVRKHGTTSTSHNKVWVKGNTTVTPPPPLPPSKKFSPPASSASKTVGNASIAGNKATVTEHATSPSSKKPSATATAMNKAIATKKLDVTKSASAVAGAAGADATGAKRPANVLGCKIITASTTIVKNNTPSPVANGSSPMSKSVDAFVNNKFDTTSATNDNHGNRSDLVVNGNTSVNKTTVKNGLSVQQHGPNDTRVINHDGRIVAVSHDNKNVAGNVGGVNGVSVKRNTTIEADFTDEAPPRKKTRCVFTDGPSTSVSDASYITQTASNSNSINNSTSNSTIVSANNATINSEMQQHTASTKMDTAVPAAIVTKEKSAAELLIEQQKKIERLRQLAIEERDDIVMDIMPDTATSSPPNLGMRRLFSNCKKSADSTNIVLKEEPISDIVNTTGITKETTSSVNLNIDDSESNGDINHVTQATQSVPIQSTNNIDSDLTFEQIVSSAFDTVFTMNSDQNTGKAHGNNKDNNDTIIFDVATFNNDVNNRSTNSKNTGTTNQNNDTVMEEARNYDRVSMTNAKIEVASANEIKESTQNANTLSSPLVNQNIHYTAQQQSKETAQTLIPTPPNEMATAPAATATVTPLATATSKKLTRLPRPWKTKMDDFGEIFYLNPLTGEVRTERPIA